MPDNPKATPLRRSESSWTPETILVHINTLIEANDKRYMQHEESTQIALKAAFEAQQTAMQAAFAAQKEAVQAAFSAQKEAIAAALAAAKEAVSKAEMAADIRFSTLSAKITALENAVNTGSGRSSGLQDGWGYLVGGIGALSALVFVLLRILGK